MSNIPEEAEEEAKNDGDMARMSAEMYPFIMKMLKVWMFIAEHLYRVILFICIIFFMLLIFCYVCKVLWWMLFVWRW